MLLRHRFHETASVGYFAAIYLRFLQQFFCVCTIQFLSLRLPVGAGGGYMFSGRPSVSLSVRPCVRVRPSVRPSVIHMVVFVTGYIVCICLSFLFVIIIVL